MNHLFRLPSPSFARLALALAVLFVAGGALPRPAVAESRADVPRYRIDLDVDNAAGTYAVTQLVTVRNGTNEAWDEIIFAVTPATLGTFRLASAAVQGTTVAGDLKGSVLRLPASPPIAPGQAVTVDLAYDVLVPAAPGRFGNRGDILSLGSFYPVLNVYRQGPLTFAGERPGWTAHQYVDVGDAFFTESSDYDVTVRLSQPATVAATGELVSQAGTTWRYRAERIREFALSVSSRFKVESIRVGRTVVTAYYLPEHAAAGTKYLNIARETVSWLNEALGDYPYPRLSIVEMTGDTVANVGQEYPGLILMSGAVWPQTPDFSDYLTYLTAHEIGHQWFYGVVGNDQIENPWIDEALVTWIAKHWQQRVALGNRTSFAVPLTRPIDAGIYDFPDDGPYFSVIYREGSALIDELYQALGNRVFFYALRGYYETFRDRVATPTGFLDLLQSYTPQNLNPIIARYLRYPKYRTAEPLRAGFWTPDVWSGPAPIVLDSLTPLSRIVVYVDDWQVWAGAPTEDLTIDPSDLVPGDHLVTAVLEDEAGRWVERSRRVEIMDPGRPAGLIAAGASRPVGRFGA